MSRPFACRGDAVWWDVRLKVGHAMQCCSYTLQHFASVLPGLSCPCSGCYGQTGSFLLWAKTPLLDPAIRMAAVAFISQGFAGLLFLLQQWLCCTGAGDGCWAGEGWSFWALQCSRHLGSQTFLPGGMRLLFSVLKGLDFTWWCVRI